MFDSGRFWLRSRAQLLGDGRSAPQISRAVAGGELRRVRTGVYAIGPVPGDARTAWLQRCAAALVAAGPDAVLAGRAAAALWHLDGFDLPQPGEPTVNVPRGSGRRGPHLRRVEALGDPALLHGLPVTSATQTLVELGLGLAPHRIIAPSGRRGGLLSPEDQVELALESALRRYLVDLDELHHHTSVPTKRRAGADVLQRVLARRPPGAPPTGSHLETRAVQVLRNAGLPEPERQAVIDDEQHRFLAKVDLLLPGRVIVELDGREHHGPDRFEHDRRRWTRLTERGYRVGVFTYEQVEFEPGWFTRRVEGLLAAAA